MKIKNWKFHFELADTTSITQMREAEMNFINSAPSIDESFTTLISWVS